MILKNNTENPTKNLQDNKNFKKIENYNFLIIFLSASQRVFGFNSVKIDSI